MRFQSIDEIAGYHDAVISAMVKIDALADYYLWLDELSHKYTFNWSNMTAKYLFLLIVIDLA